nr:glucose transporter 4 enhancer factor, isoform A [Drosophila melanogaster]NP_001262444.1 glucose transporter 4 enhancer factor, isoform H [Drosophila melanogaster]AAF54467.2 glucose transporter 4 enhancer factor, isoform A [Drosophila melanogaster]AGB95826.1 glucose transporter 4 enhancer factor, isoform H [Drosophila melanogaster]|eukprot:NP_001097734.1 glucose transporter 4 enhancer factor, isoform A [Drosophila melanogaster]
MSTGRRLAKRSIIGTKVCAKGPDGLWYSGTISDVKTPPSYSGPLSPPPPPTFVVPGEAPINADTRYLVRFDFKTAVESPTATTSSAASTSSTSSTDPSVIVETRRAANVHISPAQALRRSAMIKEFRESDLIGPGFRSIMDTELQPGQRVYFTYNGREQSGDVVKHDATKDEVIVKITTVGNEEPIELKKRLEEVRLLESRRSARLADQDRDTDFARLADMSGERRRTTTHSIEVPSQLTAQHNSRKRPPSDHQDYGNYLETCRAAEILSSMKLQSPHGSMADKCSSPGSSSSASWSSGSPSPPLSDDGHAHHSPHNIMSPHDADNARTRTASVSTSDEGIVIDYKEERKKKSKKFRCVYRGCVGVVDDLNGVVRHIRKTHLGKDSHRSADDDGNEEDFYLEDADDDVEQVKPTLASEPTLSHRDMARPPHEDPEYQKQIVGNFKQGRGGSHYNHLAQSHGRTISGSNIPSTHQQQLQNNNTSCIPTSHLAHHNYTCPAATATVGSYSSTGTGSVAASSSASPIGKHARSSSSRPTHSVAPYPSPTYVQQQQHHQHTHHHNYAGSSGSSNSSSSSSPVIHSNSSANNMLQQLSQQNVTVTAHHSQQQQQLQQQQHHQQQQQHSHQQQQQHLLSSVTITPNFHPAQQQHHHQPMRGHQQQHPQTTAGNMVAQNNSNNHSNGSNPLQQQQHMAQQVAVKHTPHSPGKRTRGENKKCRKVYGMEKRDQWCTQCRWKKACSRFGD